MPALFARYVVLEARKSAMFLVDADPRFKEEELKVSVALFVEVETPMKELADDTLYEAMPVLVASPVNTLPATPLIEIDEVVMKAVELNAFDPRGVVVPVPPLPAGMMPVREKVVLPFVTVEVMLPDPKRLKARPVYPFTLW